MKLLNHVGFGRQRLSPEWRSEQIDIIKVDNLTT